MNTCIFEHTSDSGRYGTPFMFASAWLYLADATEQTKDFIIEQFPASDREKQDPSINHAIVIEDTREVPKCLNILFPSLTRWEDF